MKKKVLQEEVFHFTGISRVTYICTELSLSLSPGEQLTTLTRVKRRREKKEEEAKAREEENAQPTV